MTTLSMAPWLTLCASCLLGHPLPLHTPCPTPAVHTINTVTIPETDSDVEPFPISDLKINPDLTPKQSEALH